MTVLSVIGFLALSFTIVGGIAGGVLGLTLGKYAGRKLKKKMKKKGPVSQEELFRTKLECLLKLGVMQKNLMKKNLNKYRISLEKVKMRRFAYNYIDNWGIFSCTQYSFVWGTQKDHKTIEQIEGLFVESRQSESDTFVLPII